MYKDNIEIRYLVQPISRKNTIFSILAIIIKEDHWMKTGN